MRIMVMIMMRGDHSDDYKDDDENDIDDNDDDVGGNDDDLGDDHNFSTI